MIAVDLPWPSRILHPNSRPHWAERSRATKAARLSAYVMTKGAMTGSIDADAVRVRCTFSPPLPKRHRDLDGLLSSCKAYFDGIADAIGLDDSKFQHQAPAWGPPCKGGNVRIEITDTWEHISEPIGRIIAAIPTPKRDAA